MTSSWHLDGRLRGRETERTSTTTSDLTFQRCIELHRPHALPQSCSSEGEYVAVCLTLDAASLASSRWAGTSIRPRTHARLSVYCSSSVLLHRGPFSPSPDCGSLGHVNVSPWATSIEETPHFSLPASRHGSGDANATLGLIGRPTLPWADRRARGASWRPHTTLYGVAPSHISSLAREAYYVPSMRSCR